MFLFIYYSQYYYLNTIYTFHSIAMNICAQGVATASCKKFNLRLAADGAHFSTIGNTI